MMRKDNWLVSTFVAIAFIASICAVSAKIDSTRKIAVDDNDDVTGINVGCDPNCASFCEYYYPDKSCMGACGCLHEYQ